MRTITYNLYNYAELSEASKGEAYNNVCFTDDYYNKLDKKEAIEELTYDDNYEFYANGELYDDGYFDTIFGR